MLRLGCSAALLGLIACSGQEPSASTGATATKSSSTTTTSVAASHGTTTSTTTAEETLSTSTTTGGKSSSAGSTTTVTVFTGSTGASTGGTTTTGAETEATGSSTTTDLACLTWEFVEGGLEADYVNQVAPLAGGAFALAGRTKSKGAGLDDFWLLLLSEEGEPLGDFTYGSAAQEVANTIAIAPDQSMLLAGIITAQGKSTDGLMIGTSSDGTKLWELQLGDSDADFLMAAIPVTAGGFAVVGTRDRVGKGTGNFWLVRVSDSGELLWTKTYGDDSDEQLAYDLVETEDGGFALGGANAGDFWLVRTNANGQQLWAKKYGGPSNERALGLDLFDDGGFAVGGWADTDGVSDFYLVRTDASGEALWEVTLDEDYSDLAEDVQVVDDGGILTDAWVLRTDPSGSLRCR